MAHFRSCAVALAAAWLMASPNLMELMAVEFRTNAMLRFSEELLRSCYTTYHGGKMSKKFGSCLRSSGAVFDRRFYSVYVITQASIQPCS